MLEIECIGQFPEMYYSSSSGKFEYANATPYTFSESELKKAVYQDFSGINAARFSIGVSCPISNHNSVGINFSLYLNPEKILLAKPFSVHYQYTNSLGFLKVFWSAGMLINFEQETDLKSMTRLKTAYDNSGWGFALGVFLKEYIYENYFEKFYISLTVEKVNYTWRMNEIPSKNNQKISDVFISISLGYLYKFKLPPAEMQAPNNYYLHPIY